MSKHRVNGSGPRLVVPEFLGVDGRDWTDLPPAAYPLATIDGVIKPRLEAGDDLIKLDGYLCDGCQGLTITIDRHPGIAPALVDHKRFDPSTRCPGMAHSIGRPVEKPPAPPSHEFYRPSEDELVTLPDAYINHVLRGGLLLRPIPLAHEASTGDVEAGR